MRLLDLCAGIGGFSLAAHWLGWTTEAFCEKDKFCQKVLAKNFPGVPIYDDVFTFPSNTFRRRIDVLTAGFPCQPFSAAGKRKGRNDERHLFPQILEIVERVQPSWCVFENVRGLLSIESGRLFAEITSSVERLGFEVVTFCIPASALNAPHRRDRLWIVANAERRGRSENREFRSLERICRTRTNDAVQTPKPDSYSDASDPDNRERSGICVGLQEKHAGISNSGSDASNTPGERSLPGTHAGIHSGKESSGSRNDEPQRPDRDATDSDNERHFRGSEQGQDGGRSVSAGCGNDRAFSESSVSNREPSNAINTRLQGNELSGTPCEGTGASRSTPERTWDENWLEAATRLCTLDDGLPGGLVRPKGWRVNALKAAGNSIVPQIAYEIFKAIEQAEQ